MKFINLSILSLIFLISSTFSKIVAQSIDSLTVNQQHSVKIFSFTAVGDLINLEKSNDANVVLREVLKGWQKSKNMQIKKYDGE